jgi:hypothetical protein
MVTPVGQFQDKVIRAMYAELNKKLTSAAFKTSIRRGVMPILEDALRAQPEYQHMVAQDGRLRAELGVVDSESAMESLVSIWARSTTVRVNRPRIVGNRILGTIITVRAIQADYQDVLNQAWASYITERGQEIPWLNWLLTKGDAILVAAHKIWHPPFPTARSRTGTNTIMVKSKGRGWGIPTEYTGTEENNFATRAVIEAMPEIEHLVETETKRRF